MKAGEVAKLLANRINQEHYILDLMNKLYLQGLEDGKKLTATQSFFSQEKKECSIHSTDWNGKCFKCGEQVFIREPKEEPEPCCKAATGFSLGIRCPTCNLPFRDVIKKPT